MTLTFDGVYRGARNTIKWAVAAYPFSLMGVNRIWSIAMKS